MSRSSRFPLVATVTLAVVVPSAAPMPVAAKSASLIELNRSNCSTVTALTADVAPMPATPTAVVPIPAGSMAQQMLRQLQQSWNKLDGERSAVLERLAAAEAEQAACARAAADVACVGPEVAALEQQVRGINGRLGILTATLNQWQLLQTRVARFLRSGRQLPKGHPTVGGVETGPQSLPSWHPPTGKRPNGGKASPRALPPAHPPIPEGYGLGSRVNTEVIEI